MENKYEQFEKLLQDTEAAKKVLVPSVEETQKNLAKLGMDFSIDELNEIASGAFDTFERLEEVVLPDSVKSIEPSAPGMSTYFVFGFGGAITGREVGAMCQSVQVFLSPNVIEWYIKFPFLQVPVFYLILYP